MDGQNMSSSDSQDRRCLIRKAPSLPLPHLKINNKVRWPGCSALRSTGMPRRVRWSRPPSRMGSTDGCAFSLHSKNHERNVHDS
jgi:hypothetical protein